MFGSLDSAPEGFGAYAGQLFVVDVGHYEIPVPLGQALRADGKVPYVTPEGKLELVASGLINPWGLRFVGNVLWVSDINGDFIYGKRELPDGFIVAIEAQIKERVQNNGPFTSTVTSPLLIAGARVFMSSIR